MGRKRKEGKIIFLVSGPTGSVAPGSDCASSPGPWELAEIKTKNKTKGKEACTIIIRQQ